MTTKAIKRSGLTASRVLAFVFLAVLATPLALTLTADDAAATGYFVRTGSEGEVYCDPPASADCPS